MREPSPLVLSLTAAAVAVAAALVGATLAGAQEGTSSADPARVEAGEALYAENCQPCHGDKGKGDGPAARFLDGKPHDLSSGQWEHAEGGTPEAIARVIAGGIDGTEMEPFDEILTEQEIRDVALYVFEVIAPKR